ncbi:MAG TPA: LuxR C-terminal-related transcriptional regulator [Gaiellaceae bacterium]
MTATYASADILTGGPSDEGVLFESKLQRVRAPRDVLGRARLTDVLQESAPMLVLLAAPPGFGKTTVLAQWSDLDGRAFACVSLDSGDNDPVALWSYVVHAIRSVAPDCGDAALTALRQPRPDVVQTVVPAVLSDLEAVGGDLVLVLDDYQEITSRICHDSLAFFIERAPRNVTVALSTRSDPPIPLARLRALDELLELRAADLCLTQDEAAAFLNETLQLGLAVETLGVLHERTEGWPVGVHLAAMSLAQEPDRAGFVARFGGANRHVVDYLTEVVLDTLDEDSRRFLLETSVLEGMCGPLCDAVARRQDSGEMLVELEHANLFLVPLDDRREWYRFHQLFAEVLRNQLLRSDAECAREVHGRASEWYAANGYGYEAVRHAVAADELERAVTLVFEGWRPSLEQGHAEASLRQLEELPWTNVERDGRLALVKAWALGVLNRREESLAALEAAEAARFDGPMPCGLSFEAATALTRACFPWGDSSGMLAAATRVCELQGDTLSSGRPLSLLALGWARLFAGDYEVARAPLEQAAFLAARSKQWLIAGIAKALLARISLEADDVGAAVPAARRALSTLELHGLADQPGAGVAHVALGAALARGTELEEAGRLLDRGLANLRIRRQPLDIVDSLLVSAPVRRTLEGLAPARELLEEARTLIASCPDPGVLTGRLLNVARGLTPAHRRIEGDSDLTERELEVLRYLAEGLSKREIGKVLFLSFNTIHSHTKSIYQKLRVSSRQEAVARARALGAM